MFEEIATTPSLKLKKRLSEEELASVCEIIRDRISPLLGENPIASVVVSAFNEEMYMLAMLLAMSRLETQYPLEFIGVNNASTDRTGEIFDRCGFLGVDEPKKGLSYARQAGLNEARGEFIFCTDADILVPSTWIEASLQYFHYHTDLVCFSGGVSDKTLGSSPLYSLLRLLIRRLRGTGVGKPRFFSGQNLVYRKDIAMQFGGYKPGVNLGEDGRMVIQFKRYGSTLSVSDNPKTEVTSSGRRTANIGLVIKMLWERKSRIFGHKSEGMFDFSDVR